MTMRLIHVDQLETLYQGYWVTCHSGVIWGHWGQKVIFTKNVIIRIVWPQDSYMMMNLRPSTYVMRSHVNLGSFEFLPAGYADCVGSVSSDTFILLVSVFFLATRLFHILPIVRFWPYLVKVTSTLTTTQAQTMMGSAVTVGSLGSKRSFSPKRHQVLQNT